MSVLWHHGVRTGKLSRTDFVKVTSTNTAQIFNIHLTKGTIAIGSDADIVVWDPEGHRTISAKTHHQNIDFNIFEGMEVQGIARTTLSRGRIVWHDGDLRTVRGTGRYVNRPCFAPYWHNQMLRNELNEPTPVKRTRPVLVAE